MRVTHEKWECLLKDCNRFGEKQGPLSKLSHAKDGL